MREHKPVAVVVGAGPGNGAALGRRFAEAGYNVALLARTHETIGKIKDEIPNARGYICDVTDAASVETIFVLIRQDMGEVDALLYNAGSGIFESFESTTAEQFEQSWRVNALGAFLCVKQVLPSMKAAKSGSIVFIGATASRRGGKKTAAFASAKAAQRSFAESLARSYGPEGVHVALIIVDGIISAPAMTKLMADKPAEFFVAPDAVAETAYQLSRQHHSAWSFEVEARPFLENW